MVVDMEHLLFRQLASVQLFNDAGRKTFTHSVIGLFFTAVVTVLISSGVILSLTDDITCSEIRLQIKVDWNMFLDKVELTIVSWHVDDGIGSVLGIERHGSKNHFTYGSPW